MRRLQVVLNTTACAWAQGLDLPREKELAKEQTKQAAFIPVRRSRRTNQRTRFYSFGQYAHQP